MTADGAAELATRFLASSSVGLVAVVKVEALVDGFLVFYQDPRALAGDESFRLFGNIPIVVSSSTGAARFSGAAPGYREFAVSWLAEQRRAERAH